jgi:ribonuclease HI
MVRSFVQGPGRSASSVRLDSLKQTERRKKVLTMFLQNKNKLKEKKMNETNLHGSFARSRSLLFGFVRSSGFPKKKERRKLITFLQNKKKPKWNEKKWTNELTWLVVQDPILKKKKKKNFLFFMKKTQSTNRRCCTKWSPHFTKQSHVHRSQSLHRLIWHTIKTIVNLQNLHIGFDKIKAHTNNFHNDQADHLAKTGARSSDTIAINSTHPLLPNASSTWKELILSTVTSDMPSRLYKKHQIWLVATPPKPLYCASSIAERLYWSRTQSIRFSDLFSTFETGRPEI